MDLEKNNKLYVVTGIKMCTDWDRNNVWSEEGEEKGERLLKANTGQSPCKGII